jgi:hypothetical protein
MNKTCKNCFWNDCNWLDKIFCIIRNRLDWTTIRSLPTGEFDPFPTTKANVSMPEVKPAKEMIKFYSNYPVDNKCICEVEKIQIPPFHRESFYRCFNSVDELSDMIKNNKDGSHFVIGYNHSTHLFYLYHDEED